MPKYEKYTLKITNISEYKGMPYYASSLSRGFELNPSNLLTLHQAPNQKDYLFIFPRDPIQEEKLNIEVLEGSILITCKVYLDSGFETIISLLLNESLKNESIYLSKHTDYKKVCEVSAVGEKQAIAEILAYSVEVPKQRNYFKIYVVIASFILLSALLVIKFIHHSRKRRKRHFIIKEKAIVDMTYNNACRFLESINMNDRMV